MHGPVEVPQNQDSEGTYVPIDLPSTPRVVRDEKIVDSLSDYSEEFPIDVAVLPLIQANGVTRQREREFHREIDDMVNKIVKVKHFFNEQKKIEQLATFAKTFEDYDKLPRNWPDLLQQSLSPEV